MIDHRTRDRDGHHARIRPHRLARDRAGVVVLTLLALGIPPRVWTVLTMPASTLYATFPLWAQCMVLAAYAGQLGAEAWGSTRLRATAALVSACCAGGVAWMFWAGDSMSGGAATWAAAAAMQLWAYSTLIHVARLEAKHDA